MAGRSPIYPVFLLESLLARKSTSSGSPRSSSSRRKPVTIDLDAKPVEPAGKKAEPAAPVKSASTPSPAKATEKPPEKPAQASGSKAAATEAAASAARKPAEPTASKPEGAPAAAEKAAQPAAAVQPAKSKTSPLPLVAAALIGGAVSLAGAVGLDRLNVVDIFGGSQIDAVPPEKIADLESGLESVKSSTEDLRYQLETQDGQISALKAQEDSSSDEALGALQTRIDALQAEIAGLPATAAAPDLKPLETRLAELESLIGSGGNGREIALEALETRLTGLSEKIEAQGDTSSEIAPLNERLAALESGQKDAIAALDGKIAALVDTAAEASAKAAEASAKAESAAPSSAVEGAVEASKLAARKAEQAVAIAPVLAAESLQRAVEAGQPFEPALTAFANLGIEDPAIAALQPFAAGGLPTIAALSAEYSALEETFTAKPAADEPEETGSLDRLLKGALSVVKVRPAEPQAGDDTNAIGSRIKGALAGRDLKTALAEWQSLPDDHKAASRAWADKVEAIIQANSFADKVRAGALARLNTTQ
jgi:hypothetical protein